MSVLVRLSQIGNVQVITIDNPPVNALSPGVPEGIEDGIETGLADAGIDAIVLLGSGRTFVAGADIRELEKMARGEKKRGGRLKEILVKIEDSPKPVVAALHGNALGGGLELAMACHYRVAAPGTKIGQPEVKLGIIPGAAGTQRLARLIGPVRAAEMCAVGDPIAAEQAFQLGLVDAIISGDLLEGAVRFLNENNRLQSPPPKTRERKNHSGANPETKQALADLRDRLLSKNKRGSKFAAMAAIQAVEEGLPLSFEDACANEEKLFELCLGSRDAQAMMHVFFGERTVAKIPDVPPTTPTHDVKSVAILGAGTMGVGIATAYAATGISVLLQDADPASLEKGRVQILSNLERMRSKRGWSATEFDRRAQGVKTTEGYKGFNEVDLVVEAVIESMELKKKVFADLDRVCRAGCILASNTSTLSIDEIASATARPEWVVGHHFFSPAHVMRLLEIVRGKATRPDVLATSMNLAKKLGKIGVLAGNCRGFIGNRMYGPYQREAQFVVEEGADPEQVDRVMEEFGMAMGPLAVGDLAGLDVGWRVRKEAAHLVPEKWRKPRISDYLCELGRFGQKSGRGWYTYQAGSRERTSDPEIEGIAEKVAKDEGIKRRVISDVEIQDRLLLALIVEGFRILEEGYALRPVDIDIVYVHGYGFPPHHGGPMFHAESVGLASVLERARELEKTQGEWWKPPALLEKLARANTPLRDLQINQAK